MDRPAAEQSADGAARHSPTLLRPLLRLSATILSDDRAQLTSAR
jgi:hypothetical protein